MHQSIIIIEDFYDNPEAIRNLALGLEYDSDPEHTYPGINSTKAFWPVEAQQKLSFLVGNEVNPTDNMANGVFRLSPEASPHRQDIHIDPGADWAGVLFLNLPHQCKGGTYFWKHNQHGFEWCPRTPEEGAQYGFNSYEQIQKEIIYGDGLDRSKWERTIKADMKFNRLVLFRPWMWHSHGENFGTTKFDTRLVQLFFLSNAQVENMSRPIQTEQAAGTELDRMINIFNEHHINKDKNQLPLGSSDNPISPKYFFED